ncbi:calcium and integrin-binding family member 3 isoform X2 [Selaginella moellendorffii]|uniref:calcium and integrin-binding family member 3 isoform X2 n=1 Tax=Selaginella moellendorffii TaxID=88036 RepID=UPI000D1C535D|nr:calcium and integrin-binding family member 3 isoform X2 [Selaginella moellendorffii]|eukprot:XP_024517853.1 calcium and integrin-binding family member 3 isoform X2 [Selaginella moellendorffii]
MQSLRRAWSWLRRRQQEDQGPQLSAEDMGYYTENSFFSAREVAVLYKKFHAMCKEGWNVLTHEDLTSIEEMLANPFAPRILELFSEDGSGFLTFEKFVNMAGVFSAKSPPEVKMIWAFALWDFDGDDVIGDESLADDLKQGISLITQTDESSNPSALATLGEEQIDEVVSRVLQEIDPNNYGLNYADFRKVLQRMPDFINNFHMNFIA